MAELNVEEEKVQIEMEVIGYVPVDTGMVAIGDPANIEEYTSKINDEMDKGTIDLNEDHKRGKLFWTTEHEHGNGNCCNPVFFVSTGIGDGYYPIIATYVNDPVWGKRVARLEIDFGLLDDDDEEE